MKKFLEKAAEITAKINVRRNTDYTRSEIYKTGYVAKMVNSSNENERYECEFVSIDEFIASLVPNVEDEHGNGFAQYEIVISIIGQPPIMGKGGNNMENIVRNIKDGVSDGKRSGVELARHIADEHEKSTGNRCLVRRIVDYVDQFDGRDREHFSFDIVEII